MKEGPGVTTGSVLRAIAGEPGEGGAERSAGQCNAWPREAKVVAPASYRVISLLSTQQHAVQWDSITSYTATNTTTRAFANTHQTPSPHGRHLLWLLTTTYYLTCYTRLPCTRAACASHPARFAHAPTTHTHQAQQRRLQALVAVVEQALVQQRQQRVQDGGVGLGENTNGECSSTSSAFRCRLAWEANERKSTNCVCVVVVGGGGDGKRAGG